MRVILTARSTFTTGYERYLQRLVNILGAISKNPSNPLFDQYIFESVSALIRYVTHELYKHVLIMRGCRFVVSANPSTLSTFEQALFGPFTIIIQQDIDREPSPASPFTLTTNARHAEYIPYAFQILAQMLELHKTDVPADYRSLLPFLLTPAAWQQKGSIPGLVKLLKAFLSRDATQMVATGQFTAILAVVQQRLIPSKLNDAWGFELLQSVVQHIPP